MTQTALRERIRAFLNFHTPEDAPAFDVHETFSHAEYDRLLIRYENEEDNTIPAYLFIPRGDGPFPAVLINHQHNSEWHLGKSEVCGLAGDPLQAFGPALASKGFVILAPDSICFEDRRADRIGTERDEKQDWLQHYNTLAYRLLRGEMLMTRVLTDAAIGVSILHNHPQVDSSRIGTLGHSYGGNTVLFHTALDERIRFACASGAACSYARKMRDGSGIEMAEVIPGFVCSYDIHHLVKCIAPRPLLLLSADEDKYSMDADAIVEQSIDAYASQSSAEKLVHKRYSAGHALTHERVTDIIDWIASFADHSA